MESNMDLINKLNRQHQLNSDEWGELLRCNDEKVAKYTEQVAREQAKKIFGNKIYVRGLIEISNYCKNNCFYCGIRRGNTSVERYRLTKEQILACAEEGYGT